MLAANKIHVHQHLELVSSCSVVLMSFCFYHSEKFRNQKGLFVACVDKQRFNLVAMTADGFIILLTLFDMFDYFVDVRYVR